MKKWLSTTALAILLGLNIGSAHAASNSLPVLAATDPRFTINGMFYESWAYTAIGLKSAWTYNSTTKTYSGFTGKGVTVAVFDTGLDQTFAHKFNQAQGYNIYGNGGLGVKSVTNDNGWHGTYVSSLIGANMNGPGPTIYGAAPNTKIMPIQIFDAAGQAAWTDAQLSRAISYAATNGAMVMNNSWNHSSTLAELGTRGPATLQRNLAGQISAWRNAIGNQGTLVVFAAGNFGKADPGYFGALPEVDARLKGGWITVVATDQTGAIASFSNRCGVAASYCMAAPGSGMIGLYKGSLATGSGTSFAAPMVSAAAAMMLERWPSLKGTDVQRILFNTANKSGIYADQKTYGQGMLDLNKAFAPIGTVTVATGATTATPGVALNSSGIRPSSGFGTSLASALGQVDAMVLDEYKRDYSVNLGSGVGEVSKLNYWGNQLATFGAQEVLVGDSVILQGSANGIVSSFATNEDDDTKKVEDRSGPSYGVSIMQDKKFEPAKTRTAKVSTSQAKSSVGINVSPSLGYGPFANNSVRGNDLVLINSVGNPYMNMAPNSNSASIAVKWDDNHLTRIGAFTNTITYDNVVNVMGPMPIMTGINIEHTVKGKLGYLSVSGGVVNEQNSVLGSYSTGAMTLGRGANTAFAGLSGGLNITNSIQAFGGATVGYTQTLADPNSMIKNVRNLTSANAYAGVVKTGLFTNGDRLGVVASVPMRVNTGTIDLNVPTSQNADGVISYSNKSVALRNNHLEYSLQAFYTLPIDQWQSIGVGTGVRYNALDLEGNNTREQITMARYNLRF